MRGLDATPQLQEKKKAAEKLHGLLSRSTLSLDQTPYGTNGTSVIPIANAIAVHSAIPSLLTIVTGSLLCRAIPDSQGKVLGHHETLRKP
jgi:hypothetical protein